MRNLMTRRDFMKGMAVGGAALGSAGLLASCGSSSDSSSTSSTGSSSTTASDSSSSSGDVPVITIWTIEVEGLDLDNCLMTTTLEEMFNCDIQWQTFSSADSSTTQFNLSIASGDYPDIYFTMWFSPEQVTQCAQEGIFLPLNDYIYAGSNYLDALEENSGWEGMVTSNDGNIYTFFYNDTGVHKASEYKMWYRTDWLENLGWDHAPETTEEFKQYLIDIRDNDPNGNGDSTDEIPLMGYYGGRQTDPICFLMNPFELYTSNYYYITDDNEIHFSAITDEWREGLAYIADLYAEGLIAEETYVQDQSTFSGILNKTADEAVVGVFPAWYNGAEIDTSVMSWFTYEPLAPLKGNYQQTAARFGGNFNLLGAITTSCENPDLAFEILDYLVSKEGSKFGMWGVEGVTYEVVEQESFSGEDTAIVQTVDSLTSYLWNSGHFPRYDTEECRYAAALDESTIETDNTYVLVHAAEVYEPYYVNHNIPDVVWCDDEDVTQEVSDLSSLINDYIKTSDTQFIMGTLDINNDSDWQNYLDTLDSMGLQQYITDLYTYYGLT